jgi:hypothetical protein
VSWHGSSTGEALCAMTAFVGIKDLARAMGLSVRSVKRWWKKLGVPPTVPGHACHRWSLPDADKLIATWQAECQAKFKNNANTTLESRSRRGNPLKPTL